MLNWYMIMLYKSYARNEMNEILELGVWEGVHLPISVLNTVNWALPEIRF